MDTKTTIPEMKTVRQIAAVFHVNKDRVRRDCRERRLKHAVRVMRGGKLGFWISVPSAMALYGPH